MLKKKQRAKLIKTLHLKGGTNMNVRELIDKRVRVVNVDNLWDKDRYNPNGESYKPSKYILNGDEGIIREDYELLSGLFIEFDNRDVSQTYDFGTEYEHGVRYLLDAIEVLEK